MCVCVFGVSITKLENKSKEKRGRKREERERVREMRQEQKFTLTDEKISFSLIFKSISRSSIFENETKLKNLF